LLKGVVKGGLGENSEVEGDVLQYGPKALEEFVKSTVVVIMWHARCVIIDLQLTKGWKDEGSGEALWNMKATTPEG
jgi:hypothetical protein